MGNFLTGHRVNYINPINKTVEIHWSDDYSFIVMDGKNSSPIYQKELSTSISKGIIHYPLLVLVLILLLVFYNIRS